MGITCRMDKKIYLGEDIEFIESVKDFINDEINNWFEVLIYSNGKMKSPYVNDTVYNLCKRQFVKKITHQILADYKPSEVYKIIPFSKDTLLRYETIIDESISILLTEYENLLSDLNNSPERECMESIINKTLENYTEKNYRVYDTVIRSTKDLIQVFIDTKTRIRLKDIL